MPTGLTRIKRQRRALIPFNQFEPYELDRKRPRNLRYDANALADFEETAGMGFAELFSKRAVFAAARALIWAGLKHEDRMLSKERVGELLSDYLKDETVERGEHSVDTILQFALAAAVEQGALGRAKELDEDEPSTSADPNAEGEVVRDIPKVN